MGHVAQEMHDEMDPGLDIQVANNIGMFCCGIALMASTPLEPPSTLSV